MELKFYFGGETTHQKLSLGNDLNGSSVGHASPHARITHQYLLNLMTFVFTPKHVLMPR